MFTTEGYGTSRLWTRTLGRLLGGEDRCEFVEVNVAAGDYADDFAVARKAREGAGNGRGSGSFGDDAVSFGEETHGDGDLFERGDEGPVDKALGEREHLREDGPGTDTVDKAWLIVGDLRRSGGH